MLAYQSDGNFISSNLFEKLSMIIDICVHAVYCYSI